MDPRKMMGFQAPGDQKVPIMVRDWNAMKLAVWRSKAGWDIAEREATAILNRCEHAEGCPAVHDETKPCLSERYEKERARNEDETDDEYAQVPGVRVREGCPDRELRMSALVVLNAARMFAPVDARRPANEPYFAPSREYFSEVLSELGAAQIELEVLREALRAAGVPLPSPSAELTTLSEALLTERAPPPQLSQPLEEPPT
jgi:hypothetical protein